MNHRSRSSAIETSNRSTQTTENSVDTVSMIAFTFSLLALGNSLRNHERVKALKKELKEKAG